MTISTQSHDAYLNPPNCTDCGRSTGGNIRFRVGTDSVICPQCKGKRKKLRKRKKAKK